MKKLNVILTAALLSLSLLSCGTKPAAISEFGGIGRQAPPEPEKTVEIIKHPYRLSRTNPVRDREDAEYPMLVVLRSRSELERYVSETEGYYDYDTSFYDLATEYDASFFERNSLIMAVLFSPCGSYKYRIDGFTETDLGYSMQIVQLTHEADTEDIAVWHLINEVPKGSLIMECADSLTITVTNELEA